LIAAGLVMAETEAVAATLDIALPISPASTK